jgi:hypothetical protein
VSVEAALDYAERFGWYVFPCIWRGPDRKKPLIKDQHQRASLDRAQITTWWGRWPQALIGVSCGRSGLVVLDIDIRPPTAKRGWIHGFDTLAELGFLPLPETPLQHTAGGGVHAIFAARYDEPIRASNGMLGRRRGPDGKWISGGLDVRAGENSFIAAAPGSGYAPDPVCNLDTVALARAPTWLNPPEEEPRKPRQPVRPCRGLSPYADAAIQQACLAIRAAGDGVRHTILRDQSFSIGTLAGAGGIPADFARDALIDAGCGMIKGVRGRQWNGKEIERVVNTAFAAGLGRPRPHV